MDIFLFYNTELNVNQKGEKMKRTITINEDFNACYGGRELGYIAGLVRLIFDMPPSEKYKYAVTIVEGEGFRFYYSHNVEFFELWQMWEGDTKKKYLGLVCVKKFSSLFFPPKMGQTYDITVKKVKK